MRKLLAFLSVLLLAFASPVFAQSATPVYVSPLPTLSNGQVTSPMTDVNGRLIVSVGNNTASTVTVNGLLGVNRFSTSVAGSSVLLSGGTGYLYGLNVTSGASAGYVMVFNAASAPGDGTVTPALCYVLAANSTLNVTYSPPVSFSSAITAVFSTTGCFTKTASATAFITGFVG